MNIEMQFSLQMVSIYLSRSTLNKEKRVFKKKQINIFSCILMLGCIDGIVINSFRASALLAQTLNYTKRLIFSPVNVS